jgi:hypothetical protein
MALVAGGWSTEGVDGGGWRERSLFDFRLQMLNKQRSSILPFSLSSNSPSQDIDIHALS